MRVRCGQIWLVTLDPTVADEQAGSRPCVVISADRFNALSIRQGVIVPLTTRERGLPHHVRVVDDGGLNRASWAMCEAVRAVSTQRFGRLLATADEQTTSAIARQITRWLGDVHPI
ncbi:type II toxin-antitoxin system PemK/MazF family toxin [Frankia sp. Cas8]|uniref:type II toxin-antitoxin system PemK/MazF family toxin n=1 Tax=unclassified Frankia TaxID=2632575 RepID=UPI003A100096